MIRFDDVSLRYDAASRDVLRHVTFEIPEGDLCLIVGRTGTGKSSLLSAINGLVPHFTGGVLSGDVRVDGRGTRTARPRDMAELVGFVGQNPLAGFVTDRVEDEIAYGMEQLGIDAASMRKRVEETLDLMGIADLRARPLLDLSGGQQQRVAIAAVLAAQPRVLVLDEPTSALDPTAAQDVLASILTLVHDVGMTVVLAEHRLERVMHAADSVAWLPGDGTVVVGEPARVLGIADVVPPLAGLARVLGWDRVPLSVRQARRRVAAEGIVVGPPPALPTRNGDAVIRLRDVQVAYGATTALRGVTEDFAGGEVTALMGRNGAGKSTLLWAIQGAVASRGDVDVSGEDPRHVSAGRARELVSLVPQSAADLLYLPTVADECAQADKESEVDPGTTARLLARLGVTLDHAANPRDLSEGQRLALVLAIQLASRPSAVLLDEPTRGLDYAMKDALAGILRGLAEAGTCVVVSTHDVEFAAAVADRVVVLGDGEVVADGTTRAICTSSAAFSPQVSKVFWPSGLLTLDDLQAALALADDPGGMP
ncbi:MAG: ATP-binding cassette domain-containing protein [Actinomycetia bacterium]|nr:ATP-binding cassette domain-containing protein [Actinomycetes bacterium]